MTTNGQISGTKWAPMGTYCAAAQWVGGRQQMPILVKPPPPPLTGKEKWLWSAGKSAGLWNTAADPLKVFQEPAAVDPLLLLDLLLYFAWSSPPPAKDLLCFILSSWRESIAWGVSGVFGRQAFYWCDDGEEDKWEIWRQIEIELSSGWLSQIQRGPVCLFGLDSVFKSECKCQGECLALFRQEGGSMQSLTTAGNRQRTKSGWTNLGASRSAQYSQSIRPNLAPSLASVLSSK